MSLALSPARVIEYLYRQYCLEKGKEQPPGLEAAMEDELLVMDGSMMWQKVKEGMEGPLSGREMWGWAYSCVHAKTSPVRSSGAGSKKFPLISVKSLENWCLTRLPPTVPLCRRWRS